MDDWQEKKEKQEETKSAEANPKKPVIPSFTDAFENTDKPEYLMTRKSVESSRQSEIQEKASAIKFFNKNPPSKRIATGKEETVYTNFLKMRDQREEQLEREAREREEAAKRRTEEEIKNEQERLERVRMERSLFDDFYKSV